MHQLIPPFCLLLALAMLVVGFIFLSTGPPEASTALHQARSSGDDTMLDALEGDLQRQQTTRYLLIGFLWAGCVFMTIAAFLTMRGR